VAFARGFAVAAALPASEPLYAVPGTGPRFEIRKIHVRKTVSLPGPA
jgi:hypothetical protein